MPLSDVWLYKLLALRGYEVISLYQIKSFLRISKVVQFTYGIKNSGFLTPEIPFLGFWCFIYLVMTAFYVEFWWSLTCSRSGFSHLQLASQTCFCKQSLIGTVLIQFHLVCSCFRATMVKLSSYNMDNMIIRLGYLLCCPFKSLQTPVPKQTTILVYVG